MRVDGRLNDRLSKETVSKRCARILLFLGFLHMVKAAPIASLTLGCCLHIAAVEAFIDWHLKRRQTRLSHVVEFLSTFVGVAKWLHRDASPEIKAANFVVVRSIVALRVIRNRLQARERLEKKKTAQDYADEGRWLDWGEFKQAVAKLHQDYTESAEEDPDSEETARLLHDVCMLRLYEASPSRSGEVRLLEYIEWDKLAELRGRLSVGQYAEKERRNVITKRPNGCWYTFLANYKSAKYHGCDETEFSEDLFPELYAVLNVYLEGPHRRHLAKRGVDWVFVSVAGARFEPKEFSSYLTAMLQRLTGVRMNSNLLRSSFISDLYSKTADPAVRQSAACAMRHGVAMAEEVYGKNALFSVCSVH